MSCSEGSHDLRTVMTSASEARDGLRFRGNHTNEQTGFDRQVFVGFRCASVRPFPRSNRHKSTSSTSSTSDQNKSACVGQALDYPSGLLRKPVARVTDRLTWSAEGNTKPHETHVFRHTLDLQWRRYSESSFPPHEIKNTFVNHNWQKKVNSDIKKVIIMI